MLTYGFYNSKDHDRRYNALQMSSLFDGIIRDGVFMSIGNRFQVKEDHDMTVLVDTGRAWFDHTWTLNDALLPLTLPPSEVVLNRIDAIVLEVNATINVRMNFIKVVKGVPSANPARPTLVKEELIHQYPLAYIYVGERVTSIRQANITNMIGTSETPFVTGVLQTMNIDMLVAQWGDQWKAFYEKETTDIANYRDFWKREWEKWYVHQTNAIQNTYNDWINEWEAFYGAYTDQMIGIGRYWDELWKAWFYAYVNDNTHDIANWKEETFRDFQAWWDQLKELIEEDAAAKLAQELLDLREQVEEHESILTGLRQEHALYHGIYDNDWRTYGEVLDSNTEAVLDSSDGAVVGRTYSSELLLDSEGRPIEGRFIFCVKSEPEHYHPEGPERPVAKIPTIPNWKVQNLWETQFP